MSNHMKTVRLALNGSDLARSIDWSDADRWQPSTIRCKCGAIFKAHSRVKQADGGLVEVTSKPCPHCGSHTPS